MIHYLFFLLLSITAKKLVLIGGNLGTTGEIFTQIGRLTGRNLSPSNCDENWQTTTCPRIAVITSAAVSEAAGNSAYTKDQPNDPSYYTLFKQNGFTSRHVSAHIDNYQKAVNLSNAEGVLNLNIIQLADVIFFNGGDQARHARTWLLDNGTPNPMFSKLLTRYNNDQVVISGTSAGTMIMSNPTYGEGISFGHLYFNGKFGLAQKSTKDGTVNGSGLADLRNGTKGLQYEDNGGKMPGFIVFNSDFIFDSHFDARGRLARLIPGLHDMKKPYGIGVDQNTAMYLYNQGNTLFGSVWGQNGVWIVNNKNAHYNISNYFQVSNVYLWYLTSGDHINLSNFEINSSKSQITHPYYTGSINSTHIIDSYQTTKLITHLVDQTQNHNIGTTRTPSGYSKDTPLFQLTFSKIEGSKGYVSHSKYSVEKIGVSVKVLSHKQQIQQQQ